MSLCLREGRLEVHVFWYNLAVLSCAARANKWSLRTTKLDPGMKPFLQIQGCDCLFHPYHEVIVVYSTADESLNSLSSEGIDLAGCYRFRLGQARGGRPFLVKPGGVEACWGRVWATIVGRKGVIAVAARGGWSRAPLLVTIVRSDYLFNVFNGNMELYGRWHV